MNPGILRTHVLEPPTTSPLAESAGMSAEPLFLANLLGPACLQVRSASDRVWHNTIQAELLLPFTCPAMAACPCQPAQLPTFSPLPSQVPLFHNFNSTSRSSDLG